MKYPNFYIVGAAKAGTSSLYSYLKDIPGIFMSPIKEPNYFSRQILPDNHRLKPIRDENKYLNLFKGAKDEAILGEASPSYLADPGAAGLIHQVAPHASILISLRDPVERLFSHYLMMKRNGILKGSFYSEIKKSLNSKQHKSPNALYVERSLYFENVKRYLEIFGANQVIIIIFEEFVKNEKEAINNILKFLNLKTNLNNFKADIYNKYRVVRGPIALKILQNQAIRRFSERLLSPSARRWLTARIIFKDEVKPEMGENERKFLVDYYFEDVHKTKNLLGRSLPWKNFQT
jgi:hypothetical protein